MNLPLDDGKRRIFSREMAVESETERSVRASTRVQSCCDIAHGHGIPACSNDQSLCSPEAVYVALTSMAATCFIGGVLRRIVFDISTEKKIGNYHRLSAIDTSEYVLKFTSPQTTQPW